MKDEKCCGSCRYFLNEDIDGEGWCEVKRKIIYCHCECHCFEQQTEYDDEKWIEEIKRRNEETKKEIEKLIKFAPVTNVVTKTKQKQNQ